MSSSVLGSFRRAREWAYPQLTSSAFLEKGVLTPEEFIIAGDELVFRCPTWEWSSASSIEKTKSYLPSNKQYLITRNVPCQNRVSSLETNLNMRYEKGENGVDDDDIDEWMISSILATKDNDNENDENEDNIEDDFDILDEDGEIVEKTKALGLQDEDKKDNKDPAAVAAAAAVVVEADKTDGDDEYDDMDDYEDDDILVDEDAAAATATNTTTTNAAASNNIIKTRTYDLSITYDKYYQVPRVWMVGRSETNQPLTSKQMMEDVISDYAYKTVTIEIHPHITSSCPHASIHPCQHAKVMKAIIKNLIKGSTSNSNSKKNSDVVDDGDNEQDEQHQQQGPSVETYLFIFLKFVSSMIPTINYDFTMEVTADTSK
ncbi:Autophagy_C-domain-containing protein [Fragilariopsis cylindrus CCMP1102]|uniref:Autophagy_C-domain-containing protein n=1 Tax=Fragilariopsis cylindrus CCMP1102 TaxID=635003 RepID=A0A1E7ETB7_9STRA|nr:Autophagy_C-domain-containing protein [Fragilariopsis cylindrus CCMP1102]|eukprot:OEU09077.1 Autophagy_C-domain-containing protein [Fragilariopsis cylindrus CCMP1102]